MTYDSCHALAHHMNLMGLKVFSPEITRQMDAQAWVKWRLVPRLREVEPLCQKKRAAAGRPWPSRRR